MTHLYPAETAAIVYHSVEKENIPIGEFGQNVFFVGTSIPGKTERTGVRFSFNAFQRQQHLFENLPFRRNNPQIGIKTVKGGELVLVRMHG